MTRARSLTVLVAFAAACGGKVSNTSDEPLVAAPLPSEPVPPPPVAGPSRPPPYTLLTTCAEWPPAPTLGRCMPSSIPMTDKTALLSVNPKDGKCTLTSLERDAPPPPTNTHALLWFRDRKKCARSVCTGFDALHLNVFADGLAYNYGRDSTVLGSADILETSSGIFDDSAACGDLGCYRDFPLDMDVTLVLELRTARVRELCRTLDVTIRYTSARELQVVSLRDHLY